jgi:hypothetical protein
LQERNRQVIFHKYALSQDTPSHAVLTKLDECIPANTSAEETAFLIEVMKSFDSLFDCGQAAMASNLATPQGAF